MSPSEQLAETTVKLGGVEMNVAQGGRGSPVLVLHRDTGRHGWTAFHQALARRRRVVAPSLPGYDLSAPVPWARSVHDLAAFAGRLIDELELDGCAVVGLGFGGWIAAEVALARGGRLSALVLQSPMGVRPEAGEYADQFLISGEHYVRLGYGRPEAFAADFGETVDPGVLRQWDHNRETTCRVAWKPYLFNVTAAHLLPLIATPTLVVQCGRDTIVPPAVAEQYARLIPGARLERLDQAAHRVDQEDPETFAALVDQFIARRSHGAADALQGAR
ncbi:alpha/beta hydrolase [Phenylobacterium sp.]|uniref:alpha/beta fold hydrolase n=1 Tax=Phenylobacterium sp. TaxID=1871053 RepID=UPI002F40054B